MGWSWWGGEISWLSCYLFSQSFLFISIRFHNSQPHKLCRSYFTWSFISFSSLLGKKDTLVDKLNVVMYYHIMTDWNNPKTQKLFNAFLQLKTADEVARFCRDLMTEPEIMEFADRWLVAQELDSGKSQRKISADTGVSIATVTRVNQWLRRGMDGYRLVIDRLKPSSNSLHHHSRREKLATTS